MNLIKEYELLQTKINQLTDMNKPVDVQLKNRRIQILEQLDDEFVKEGQDSIEVNTVRIRYNSMLKYFAEELGLPVGKYVEHLKELSRRMGIPED